MTGLVATGPVVVELFSSEGCSSCPPADVALAELDRRQSVGGVTVLALEEHVDYWDDLGWRDPFGQGQFGVRQGRYATVLSDPQVYTPEIVIDGHSIADRGLDSMTQGVRAAAQEAKAQVTLARRDDRVDVSVDQVPAATDDPAEVWLAVTESGLTTQVLRGENAGRQLAHAPVVRLLERLGPVTSASFHTEAQVHLDASWKPGALRVVAFVQRVRSRKIIGAGAA
jgi:hypothetical protein